ncbi:MAG: type II toxin-antitoxin system RelE/ParE family toxin [Gammaproteobacteria bacterium]
MRLRWEADAIADLLELRAYIQQDNPGAAKRVVRKILATVKRLKEQPMLGRSGRVHGTRELVISATPYTVAYHVTPDTVTVLRVLHQAREWPKRVPPSH